MLPVKLLVDRIHPQSNKFATAVGNTAIGENAQGLISCQIFLVVTITIISSCQLEMKQFSLTS